jgi:hypothetical protein
MRMDRESTIHEDREANLIRTTEQERLRALVKANMDAAHELHADDFQLINPRGELLSKDQYLGGIATGEINYLLWEPDSAIAVRMYGRVALIRYRSQLEILVGGHKTPLRRYWHTDSYQNRGGLWQVVWCQATEIQEPIPNPIDAAFCQGQPNPCAQPAPNL